jgi:hypothetical protein
LSTCILDIVMTNAMHVSGMIDNQESLSFS